ncbi:MAG: hypothetical protein ACQEQP_01860 [Bacillota bacterium]
MKFLNEEGFIMIKILIIIIILVMVFQSTAIYLIIYSDILNGINNNIVREIDYVTSFYLAENLAEIYKDSYIVNLLFNLNNNNSVKIEIINYGDNSIKTLEFTEPVRGQTVFSLE